MKRSWGWACARQTILDGRSSPMPANTDVRPTADGTDGHERRGTPAKEHDRHGGDHGGRSRASDGRREGQTARPDPLPVLEVRSTTRPGFLDFALMFFLCGSIFIKKFLSNNHFFLFLRRQWGRIFFLHLNYA